MFSEVLTPAQIAQIAAGTSPTSIVGLGSFVETDVLTQMTNAAASSAYLRIPFNVTDPSVLDTLTLNMRYDDGFVAHLNGLEVARANAPSTPLWSSAAPVEHPDELAIVPESFNLTAHLGELQIGTNVLAIHGLNLSAGDGDFLISPELVAQDVVANDPRYFPSPTPGADNGEGVLGFVDDTQFSVDRGFYETPFTVAITSDTPGAQIYFTTDGSEPSTTNGTLYGSPVDITTTTTLRAVATLADHQPSNVDTQTYIFLEDVIEQPDNPVGFPSDWGTHNNFFADADYEMDPDVVAQDGSDLFSGIYANAIEDSLLSLPTLSIVMNTDDVFDAQTGFYANSLQHGIAWEKPMSVEMIFPDGTNFPGDTGGFQVDAGIRAHGGASRRPWATPKHSMRLYFRNEYGPGRLNYPLFGEGDIESFDRLVVRGGFNDSWLVDSASQREDIQHMRDQFVRDTFAAMGHVAAEGRYVHLYLNGLYWGLFNITERMDSEFHADHFGGDPDDYDVINHGGVVDGNDTAWSNLLTLVDADMTVDANYQAVIQQLDVDSLIDYMIVNIYSGTMDWPGNNWMAAANRVTGEGFRFFVWDAERSLEGLNDDRTNVSNSGTIAELYAKLRVNADFQRRFADRVQLHMFNDGALTPAATEARFRELADGIRDGVVAESARWGDVRYSTPATVDSQWQTNYDWRVNTYFPQRTDVVLNQLINDSLASSVTAPTFSQTGRTSHPRLRVVTFRTDWNDLLHTRWHRSVAA